MTNLIGPKPEGGPKYPTPWNSSGVDIHDANGRWIAEVTPEVIGLDDQEEVADNIVKAVNAYYGSDPVGAIGAIGEAERDDWARSVEEKADRIDQLKGQLESAEADLAERDDRITNLRSDLDRLYDQNYDLQTEVTDLRQAVYEAAQNAENDGYQLVVESPVFPKGQRVYNTLNGEFGTSSGKKDANGDTVIEWDGGGIAYRNPRFLRRAFESQSVQDIPLDVVKVRTADGRIMFRNSDTRFGYEKLLDGLSYPNFTESEVPVVEVLEGDDVQP